MTAISLAVCSTLLFSGYAADIHAILTKGEEEDLQNIPIHLKDIQDVIAECKAAGDDTFKKFLDFNKLMLEFTEKSKMTKERTKAEGYRKIKAGEVELNAEIEKKLVSLTNCIEVLFSLPIQWMKATEFFEQVKSMIDYGMEAMTEDLAQRGESGLKTRQEGIDLSNRKTRTLSRVIISLGHLKNFYLRTNPNFVISRLLN